MFSGFSSYWQADSRPTFHEFRRDLRANGYRPRAFHQSVAAQRAPTAPDCDGHPAEVPSIDDRIARIDRELDENRKQVGA